MQALTTTGQLFKQFIQFLREQGYRVHWHDISPEEPEYVQVICNGQHLMPDGVPSIPNDGVVEIDHFATIFLEPGSGGRKIHRVFKDWQAGKMFLGSTKLTPPHLVAHYERIITAAVAM
ncbi:TPA: hypothetical protein NID65_002970 [Pseudomonas aeruginosa]|nr:hypothetical protein [Pseudomonas aeruginosa]